MGTRLVLQELGYIPSAHQPQCSLSLDYAYIMIQGPRSVEKVKNQLQNQLKEDAKKIRMSGKTLTFAGKSSNKY